MRITRAILSVAVVMGVLMGFVPVYGAPPCECDLNHDGRCNMRDWLVFGQDWGRTDCLTSGVNCECDLNTDGRCNMRDWLIFGQDWGRTDCPVVPRPSNLLAWYLNSESTWVDVIAPIVPGAINYKLYSSTNGVNFNYILQNSETFGNCTFFSLDANNVDTYFRMTAVTIDGESELSETVFVSKAPISTFSITSPTAYQQGVSVMPTIRWNPSDATTTAAYVLVLEAYDPDLDYVGVMLKKCSGSVTSWRVDSSDNILVTYFDQLSGARLDYSTEYKLSIWAVDATGTKVAQGIGIKFTTMPAP